MERDEFIIHVYCLVCDLYEEFEERYCSGRSLRGGGFAPALTDPEVITIELCGEYFKQHTDQDIFDHFMSYYRDCFPASKSAPLLRVKVRGCGRSRLLFSSVWCSWPVWIEMRCK